MFERQSIMEFLCVFSKGNCGDGVLKRPSVCSLGHVLKSDYHRVSAFSKGYLF